MGSRNKKVHINVNGRLLNMGKRWNDLSLKQREYIAIRLNFNIQSRIEENEGMGIHSTKEKVY